MAAESVIINNSHLQYYKDILAQVRRDGRYHSIKALVQPEDPRIQELAAILKESTDFVTAAQAFVHGFASYKREAGDYWRTPGELLDAFEDYWNALETSLPATDPEADCDCLGIFLCSLLRAGGIAAEDIYCAFGMQGNNGSSGGHFWLIMRGPDGEDIVIEPTAHPDKPLHGKYVIHAMFNDQFAHATKEGIRLFDLKTVAAVPA